MTYVYWGLVALSFLLGVLFTWLYMVRPIRSGDRD